MKKTPWFPGRVKPAHVGVYEVPGLDSDEVETFFTYFDGVGFCGQWGYPEQAAEKAATRELQAHWRENGSRVYRWRGLASPPKEVE